MLQIANSNSETAKYGFIKFFGEVIKSIGGSYEITDVENPSSTSNTRANLNINVFGVTNTYIKLDYYPSGACTSGSDFRVYYDTEKKFIWGIPSNNYNLYNDLGTFEHLRFLVSHWNGEIRSVDEYLYSGNIYPNYYDEPFLITQQKTNQIAFNNTNFKNYTNIFQDTISNPKIYPEKLYIMPFMLGCAVSDDLYVTNGMMLNPGTVLTNSTGTYKALSKRYLYKIS